MKHIYLGILLLICGFAMAKDNTSTAPPSATISGTTTVCQNATSPIITFTGSGGTAPYTFTFTLNGATQPTITTAGTNSTITISAPTGTAGTFTYSLVSVSDSQPPNIPVNATGSAAIIVSTPPIVDFTFTNNNTCSGTSVQFTSNITGTGTYTYSWDFGDSTALSTQANPTHVFNSLGCGIGTFSVTLTVTGGGCVRTTSRNVTVKQKPDINFADVNFPFDPFSNCSNASSNPVYTITVGNTSTSTCINSFSINWGDGNTQNNVSFPISHTYSQIGAYSMVITALGNNGCSNSKTYIIKNVSNPLGGLNSPGSTQNLCAPTTNLQFSISNWGTNSLDTTYSVNYGDGTPLLVLTQIQLNNSSFYNAGSPLNSANYPIPHIYTLSSCPAQSFQVRLDVTNACGTTPFTLGNISILTKPVANFTSPLKACVNASVQFVNTTEAGYGQGCVQNAIYTWNFGDGSPLVTTPPSPTQNINHTYTAPGTYTVTLTVQNFCGSNSISKTICIEPPLSPLFTLNTNTGCTPLSITATNTTVLTNQCTTPTYLWTVAYAAGFCGTSITPIPSQTTANANFNFTTPGTYTITLATTNSCGTTTTSQTVTVKKPPTVSIAAISNSCGTANINPTATVTSCAPASSTLTYSWSFPGGTPSAATTANPGAISYTSPGNYTVSLVVTNECGASTTATQTFSVSTAPVITNTVLTQSICSGSASTPVTITANPTGTAFTWTATATAGISGFTASGTTNTILAQTITTTNSNPGTVTYVITPRFNGCNGPTVNYVITVNPAPAITTQPASSSICLGGTPTALTVAINSSSSAPSYQWYSNTSNSNTGGTLITGATNSTFNPPATPIGTLYYYCVITLTSGGCSSLNSNVAAVTINPLPTINTQPLATQNVCVGVAIAAPFTVSYTGGNGTATYQWYSNTTSATTDGTLISGATNVNYTPPIYTTAGTFYYYAIISLSGNGCGTVTSNSAAVMVFNDPTITTQPLTTQTLCQGATPITLEVIPSGGNGSFNYQWYSNTNNNTTSGSLIPLATNPTYLPPVAAVGTLYYYCVITQNTLGCSVTSTTAAVIINQSPSIVNQPVSSSVCLGGTTSTLSFTFSNGAGSPTYQWYSNSNNNTTSGTLLSGETNATFTPPANMVGTTYYYCVITFPNITGSCATVTSETALITVNQNPVIAPESTTICSNNPFTITPVDGGTTIVPLGTTYTWSAPAIIPAGAISGAVAALTPQNQISQTLINATTSPATVIYSVTPTSGLCVGANFTIIVTVNPAINPNVVAFNTTCFGANNATIATNIIGGIPPYVINWTGPNGFSSTSPAINNIAPGIYNLTIDDTGNCPYTNTYTITEPDDIIIAVDSENDITCFGFANGSIAISVTGGTGTYSYTWTKDTVLFSTDEDIANLSPGTYVVSVTDANNCGPKTETFTITQPPILAVSLVSQTNVECFGAATGAININPSGGAPIESAPGIFNYNYAWTGPNGFTSTNQNLTNIFPGTYNLVVADNQGCTATLSVIITQSTEININYTTTPITCYGANNASFSTTISGGNAPYQFQWSNLSTALNQNNLSAGTYVITVTDNLGCIKTQSIVIQEAPVFTVNPIVNNITCFGANNGSINLNLTGGIPVVTLTWSDGSTAGLIRNNLSPGTYTATISDGTPCFIVRTFTILQPQPLVISANITNPLNCSNANSGAIDLIVAGGTPTFNYSWSNGAITEDLTNLNAGNYQVAVTDANGCSATKQFSLVRPAPIVLNVSTQTNFNCATRQITQNFVAQASGGVPPFQYQWSSGTVSGPNNNTMNSNTNGTVLLTATDNIGCTATYSVVVDNPVIGSASFEATSFGYTSYGIYSINDPIQFQSNITGDYISVSWDFGDGTFSTELNPIHTYAIPKNYIVTQTVTYPFGCVYVQTISLLVEKGYLLVLPTAFTPNNDNLNDTYRPVTKRLTNVRLDIYDTWGSMIYSEIGEVLVGWDGKIKGFNAENGNYYAKVQAETFYGTLLFENQAFVLIK